MKEVGLYFGTFNPIHIGHMVVATYMINQTNMDELWFVVTPQNPHKKKQSLLANHHRLEMVYRAIEKYDYFRVSNIEFGLSQPNYTTNTLVHLREKHPDKKFSLIIGEDNLSSFHRWKNYEEIVKHHQLYIYPRHHETEELKPVEVPHTFIEAPRIELSSSAIRNFIKNGEKYAPMLPQEVYQYIDEMNFYKK